MSSRSVLSVMFVWYVSFRIITIIRSKFSYAFHLYIQQPVYNSLYMSIMFRLYLFNGKNLWSKVKIFETDTFQVQETSPNNLRLRNLKKEVYFFILAIQIGNLPLFAGNKDNLLPDFFLDLPHMTEGIKAKSV